ncbi:MAG: T9SS type A sorting domain-containing protein [Bacteroidales bacterium]|nr:T9SS type A sorting domain-containing protein [Bacteroidales bacterium]MCF8386409.1 T9SS type A sorting domain-containing protein [Bacteroidales bacterium]MCF8397899.1 T9SS type A sorting domain-containing protein [Bacteroidales bacterium]
MKPNLFLRVQIMILMVFFFQNLPAATIESTNLGGLWDDESTWIGGAIPGINDTAIVNGPVTIGYNDGYTQYNSFGGWVIVEEEGKLIPHSYGGGLGTYTLFVEHDFVNHGTLTNPYDEDYYEYLTINVKGDITNDGYWGPYKTQLTGSGQTLILGESSTFGGFWECPDETTIYAGSDLVFDCRYFTNTWNTGDFNLNGSTLDMGEFQSIETTGTVLYNGTIKGAFEIKGIFDVNKHVTDTMRFTGTVTIVDTLQNHDYGGGHGIQNLFVDGNIINEGYIINREDTGDELSILLTGNITNYGVWKCGYVKFVGTGDQYLLQSAGKRFESNFYDLDSTSMVIADSDIEITQNFELNRGTLDMQGHPLTIGGWLTNGFCHDAIIRNGILQNMTCTENLTILGKLSCDEGNVFKNTVTVSDTLQCYEYGGGSNFFDLIIEGDLYNQGVIQNYNDGDMLRIIVSGKVHNAGEWMNQETHLNGTSGQELEQAEDHYFGGTFSILDSNNTITAASGLSFGGDLHLNRSRIMMGGHDLKVTGWLQNGYAEEVELHNAYLKDVSFLGNTGIYGTVTCDEGNAIDGNLTVSDTLQCHVYGGGAKTYVLDVSGNVINIGVIKNHDLGEKLQLNISGNISNNGSWTNYLTMVNVQDEQYIELIDDKPIEGTVYFNAMLEAETYQWYYEDNILESEDFEGETEKVLKWLVPVSADWYGSFSCETSGRETVGIVLKKGGTGIVENQMLPFRAWTDHENIYIDLTEDSEANAQLYDLSGRLLDSFGIEKGLNKRAVLKTGYCIIKLTTNNRSGSRKLLIQ